MGERILFGIFVFLISLSSLNFATAEVIALTDDNLQHILNSNDVAIVNFYADWCRFSQLLKPTFEEAGNKIKEEFPESGKVVFAKVDSDKETGIAGKYRINKYPTIKLFRAGNVVKKEYRGQRSVEALVQFAKDQAENPVKEVTNLDDLNNLGGKKRHIVGYFESKDSENYKVFSRVASVLRDECGFHAAVGDISASERPIGDAIKLVKRDEDKRYTGAVANFDTLQAWASETCTPLVREITFENAEELTEEGLPFLILFHHPDDHESVELYTREVAKQIMSEKVNLNFLTADGVKFAHPLHHLGKSISDLPLICIDSFRHMYLFPHDVKKSIEKPGILKQFVEDLHSGKLHREFHHGPDETTQPPISIDQQDSDDGSPEAKNIPRDPTSETPKQKQPTSPPESTFIKLAPARNRYTFARDEL